MIYNNIYMLISSYIFLRFQTTNQIVGNHHHQHHDHLYCIYSFYKFFSKNVNLNLGMLFCKEHKVLQLQLHVPVEAV